ncbi:hypothetical protein HDV00_005968 [Rhizophlyctis rosea]|nr:hypothetical protein HDV00_005968 [Rhizophlyctis rosea]
MDPEGAIFAIAYANHISLYDFENFDIGAFDTFNIEPARGEKVPIITAISFSNDGKRILASTAGSAMYVLNSYRGFVTHKLVGHQNINSEDLVGCFTPDSRFVMCGMS